MNAQDLRPLGLAGIMIGIGVGGFFDGILFHEILQLHGMVSSRFFPDTLINEQINMFWDGLFHAVNWLWTVVGIALLWVVVKRNLSPLITKYFVGSFLLGWGLFNLVEGLINHHILELHHMVERATGTDRLLWDISFLAWGLIFIGTGIVLRRRSIDEAGYQRRREPSLRTPA